VWLGSRGYRGDGTPPPLSDEIVTRTALRYIELYETLTGTEFVPGEQPAEERIKKVFLKNVRHTSCFS
jgi:phosphoribosylaminoimidazole-succinocarboxamide synthase